MTIPRKRRIDQPDRGGTIRFKGFWRPKRTLRMRTHEPSHQWQWKPREWPVLSSGYGIALLHVIVELSECVWATMEDKRNRERGGALSRAVQGVGFRWTCRAIAAGLAVAGYVKNLADGQVLVVVEGEPDELDRFLAAVDDEMSRNIRQKSVQTSKPLANFESLASASNSLFGGLGVPRRAIQSACFSDEPNLDFPRKGSRALSFVLPARDPSVQDRIACSWERF